MTAQEITLQLRLQKAKQEFSDKIQRAVEDINDATGLQVTDITINYFVHHDVVSRPHLTVRFR